MFSDSEVIAKAVLGNRPNDHDYVIMDAATGRVRGVYAKRKQMERAATDLPPGVFIMQVLHPSYCNTGTCKDW